MASKKRKNGRWICPECGVSMQYNHRNKHVCKDLSDADMLAAFDNAIAEEAKVVSPTPPPAPVSNRKERKAERKAAKEQNKCEFCGFEAANLAGLKSHQRAKHQAQLIDIDALIAQLSKRVGYIHRTAEEAHEQALKDNEVYHKVMGLKQAIDLMEEAINTYIEKTPESLVDNSMVAKENKEIFANRKILSVLMSDASYQRGKLNCTAMEKQNAIDKAQIDIARMERAEHAKREAWRDVSIDRYSKYITGYRWVAAWHKAWQEHGGAMPFVLAFCWDANNFCNVNGIVRNIGKLRENKIIIDYSRSYLEHFGFEEEHRETIVAKEYEVDEDGNIIENSSKEVITSSLPVQEWAEDLAEIYYDYLVNHKEEGENMWCKTKKYWGKHRETESQYMTPNFRGGRAKRVDGASIAASLDDSTQRELYALLEMKGDSEAEEIQR